jgi:hypothetical protein
MKALGCFCFLVALGSSAMAASDPTGFPFQNESLHYSVNWPSGLSLGDATLTARRVDTGWSLDMGLDAAVPGFTIADRFHSSTNADQCSTEFTRTTAHGKKKSNEKTTFDYKSGRASRATSDGGGKTETTIGSCARDAVAFLYYARKELGQGRVPQQQDIYFGAVYSVRLDYTGAQTITVQDKAQVTDRVAVSFTGPSSRAEFEMYFARDAARTPLLVKIPSSVGTVSLELSR